LGRTLDCAAHWNSPEARAGPIHSHDLGNSRATPRVAKVDINMSESDADRQMAGCTLAALTAALPLSGWEIALILSDTTRVRECIAQGVHVNESVLGWATPLAVAAMMGHIDTAEAVLARHAAVQRCVVWPTCSAGHRHNFAT
jgi:hypothetical protein